MKILMVLLLSVVLCGCQGQRDYETLSDAYVQPNVPAMGEITLLLPTSAEVVTMESEENGKLWLCEEYWVCLQTWQAGDLKKTLHALTGQSEEDLDLIKLDNAQSKRYECVWLSTGENGDQINRAIILDDGNYHYALTLHTAAETAGVLAPQWKNITATFGVSTAP